MCPKKKAVVKIHNAHFPSYYLLYLRNIPSNHNTFLYLLELISFSAKKYHLHHGMFAVNHRKSASLCFSLLCAFLSSFKSGRNNAVCAIWQINDLKPHQAPFMVDRQYCSIQKEAISLLFLGLTDSVISYIRFKSP